MSMSDTQTTRDPAAVLPTATLDAARALVLTAARYTAGTADADAVRTARDRVTDWDAVTAFAGHHRLHALLFKVLRDLDAPVPDPAAAALALGYRTNAARNLKLTSLLFRLLGAFNEANIPVLVIKGLALAGPLYGDVALRRSGDVDVLIHPRHVTAAMNLVCAMEGCSSGPLKPYALKVLLRTDNEMKLRLNDELVELHWRLAPMHRLYPAVWEDLFSEAENVSMAGRGVPTLGAREILPYLCFHGTKHLWYRLFWLLDVAAWTARRADVPWTDVLGRARGRGHERALLLGLGLAHHLFAVPVPEALRPLTARADIAARIAFLSGLLLPPDDPRPVDVSDMLWWKNLYWMSPGWGTRVSVTWRYLCRPTLKDLEAFPLPSLLSPLYLGLRPLRLGTAALKQFWGK